MNKPALTHGNVGPPPEGKGKEKSHAQFHESDHKAAIARGMAIVVCADEGP